MTNATPPSAISSYELAAQMLHEIVAGGPTRFARFGYGIDFSEDAPQFGTDDFATLMMDLAEQVGIDLTSMGSQLIRTAATPAPWEWRSARFSR